MFGELLLGGFPPAAEQLFLRLPLIPEISNADTLAFIRTHKLAQQGVGWVDCTLLASAVQAKARFWARDKCLQDAAIALGVAG